MVVSDVERLGPSTPATQDGLVKAFAAWLAKNWDGSSNAEWHVTIRQKGPRVHVRTVEEVVLDDAPVPEPAA